MKERTQRKQTIRKKEKFYLFLTTLLSFVLFLSIISAAQTSLDKTEASHLSFMREEEKLARDLYLTFAEKYPNQQVFKTIAKSAEERHTNKIKEKLAQFNVPDPNPKANELPESIGIFTGPEWRAYFTRTYKDLVSKGSKSELAALYVGAMVEELDINDLSGCPEVMVEKGYPNPCGLNYTDEKALKKVYTNLIQGSENHLRAFVRQIEAIEGKGKYKAQYLTQKEVDKILGVF